MSDIIAYKDQSNEYFDVEVDKSVPVKAKSEDALNIMRHDIAHVLAEAVVSIFPKAKPTIGPFIKNGFYYDFDMENTLSDGDLNNIESKIREILKEGRTFIKKVVSKDQALEVFKDNEYKIELIKNLDNSAEITLYEQKNFTDLCKGPHHKSTKEYDAHVKITSVSGAYWRGNSTNKMLQRIYATAFYSEKDLNKYLKNLEEAKERNHRRLGTDMGLFLLTDLSAGNVFWKERGLILYQNIEKFIRSEQQKLNYKEVKTPELVSNELWIKSGHWDNFQENMFTSETDNKTFALKPMNCPCHIVLFNSQLITYKYLPLRYS
jgi:threonyl-tRNA synthetase